MKYSNNLFESIKDAFNKKTNGENAAYKDFLKLEAGNTYVVRLVPNIKNPDRTIFHYFHHIWKSINNGQYVSVLCPNTYGESCPIDEYRSKIYATKNESLIEKTKPLKRNENWLCNAYVIKDPTNPENQGSLKVLRFGKQLFEVISSAISGDDSEEFGAKIFDLSENGCSLRIKVETNEGGYPKYTASRFMAPCAVEGLENLEEVYEAAKELDAVFESKSKKEIQDLLNLHFLGRDREEEKNTVVEKEEEIDVPITSQTETYIERDATISDSDDKIQDILKDL
jgi:hypothetical protein